MNKENCAVKLVDEIMLYRLSNIKGNIYIYIYIYTYTYIYTHTHTHTHISGTNIAISWEKNLCIGQGHGK